MRFNSTMWNMNVDKPNMCVCVRGRESVSNVYVKLFIAVHFDDQNDIALLSAIISGKLQRSTPELERDKNSRENIENMH